MRRLDPGVHHHAPAELLGRLADHFVRADHGRVSWVHPSWRDLVIEYLAADVDTRRRFLHESGLHGVLLALSTGGGVHGERVLPLIVDDADWDAVGDRIGPLARELPDLELEELVNGLRTALQAHADLDHAGAELRALAGRLLELADRRWAARSGVPINIDLLGAWLRLRTAAGSEVALPDLRVTWAELLPGTDGAGFVDGRLRTWAMLVDLLEAHAPDALRALGFTEGQSAHLSRIAEAEFTERAVERDIFGDIELPVASVVDVPRILADLA